MDYSALNTKIAGELVDFSYIFSSNDFTPLPY